MNWYKICSDNYKAGFYDDESLKTFVVKSKITVEQYKEITGKEYN